MRILLLIWLSLCLNLSAQSADTPAIGGSFTLTDQNAKPFDSESLKGKYALVFFGFTDCPDTCPTTLMAITQAMKQLDEKQVTPVFISVDPKQDTPAVLKHYLSHFSPAIIGLTGSKAELDKVQAEFKVYAGEVPDKKSKKGYTVEHSANIYLMDKDGSYLDHFAADATPETIVARLKPLL